MDRAINGAIGHTVLGALVAAGLGYAVGPVILAQGYAGWLAYLIAIVVGPLLAGLLFKRWPVLVALAFNLAVEASIIVHNRRWYVEHGFDLERQAEKDLRNLLMCGALCVAAAFLALVPGAIRRGAARRRKFGSNRRGDR